MITNPTLERLADHPVLSTQRTLALIENAKHGDTNAEDKLVRHNSRLIKDVLRSLTYPRDLLDELVIAGQLAVKDAIYNYSPHLGTTWVTHVYNVIWRKMATELAYHRRASTDSAPKSRALARLTPDEDAPAEEMILESCDRLYVRQHLSVLPTRDQAIIAAYFGLSGPCMSLDELADCHGISSQRIGQLRDRALTRLKTSLCANPDTPFVA